MPEPKGNQDPKPDNPKDGESGTGDKGDADEKRYTAAELQAETDRRVTQALQKREEEHAAKLEAEKAVAEQSRLEEQGKWEEAAAAAKEVAAKAQADYEAVKAEADVLNTRAEAAEAAVKAQVEALTKELPAHIKVLVEKMSCVDALAYLAEYAEKLGAKPRGTPASPAPGGSDEMTVSEKRKLTRPTWK